MNIRGFFFVVLLAGSSFGCATQAMAQSTLQVSLTATDTTGLSVGDSVVLTIHVLNNGPNPGQGQAQVQIPDVFTYLSASCTQTQVIPPSGGFFLFLWTSIPDSGGTLGVGSSTSCDVNMKLQSMPAGSVTATATIPSNGNVTGSTDTYTFNITSPPPTIPQPLHATVSGQTVTLAFGASNADSCMGSSVTAAPGWDQVTVCNSVSACGNVSVQLTNVSAGTNDYTVVCTNGGGNASSGPVSATVIAATPTTDLTVQAAATPATVTVGQTFAFQFTASNLGTQDAPDTQVAVTTPPQIQILSSDCGLPSGSGGATWYVGTLTASSSATCNVTAKLLATASSVDELLTISFAGIDTNSANDSTSSHLTIGAGADLSVMLSVPDSNHQYAVSEPVSITLTVADATTAGDATAVVATFNVANPSALMSLASDVCGTPVGGKLTWNIGNLAHGATKSCKIAGVIASASTAIPVSANVGPTQNDTSLANNTNNLVLQTYQPPVAQSTTVSGAPTTENSAHVALNKNGSIVVFESQDPNLVQNNSNSNGQDIYSVGANGHAVLETIDSAGHQLMGTASLPTISQDGSIVAFTYTGGKAKQAKDSISGQMLAGPIGQPKKPVDTGMNGQSPNGQPSGAPSLASNSGTKKLVFCSSASNLVPSDTNGARDIFLVDPSNSQTPTQLVSTDSQNKQLQGDSCDPRISADGTKVTFTVSALSLYGTSARQVVVKDLTTGNLQVISKSSGGTFANADSSEPAISSDGSVIAFTSKASNLDDLGTPVGTGEVFISLAMSGADDAPRRMERARNGNGTVPNGSSQHPQLSNDGTQLVMQTNATNFLGTAAKDMAAPKSCGTISISTNFLTPAQMGGSLCTGSSSNQNPTISGDGTMTGLDSNAPQAGTNSTNSNTYAENAGGLGSARFTGDFSGQWYDPNQSGQGLVIDVSNPDQNGARVMLVTWYVYVNGQPTWIQAAGYPKAGSGNDVGKVVVDLIQPHIVKSNGFPRGTLPVQASLWGDMSLAFTDSSTGLMTWTSVYPGFNSGSMAIKRLTGIKIPAEDSPNSQVKACFSGSWFDHSESGDGFDFEVVPGSGGTSVLTVDWFTYTPGGSAVWLVGAGSINGNRADVTLGLINGNGAQFPPRFDPSQTVTNVWGTATFAFTDAGHATVSWNSSVPGYGSGSRNLQPYIEGFLDMRSCQ